jgi:hypothetical protein
MIVANGTVFELLMIMRHATPAFRTALLDQVNENTARHLVDRTIAAGRSIGTLHLAMREVGETDPDLLGRLEQAVGAVQFLRMIAANGTVFELFRTMEYATPAFRTALLDQLNEATICHLADKTIAVGRSIESLHYTLRQLARTDHRGRLEELVGTSGWWRLVIGAGTLKALSELTEAMSDDSRRRMIGASSALTDADWCQILSRGLFFNACTFAAGEIAGYPETSRASFQKALEQTAHYLAAKASWFDVNSSRPPEDSNLGPILREALQTRIATVTMENLLGDLDFHEAINCLSFIWRERPDLRTSLAARLWEILPEPHLWPKAKGEIATLRLVLEIARSEMISRQNAQRLYDEVLPLLDHEVWANMHTLPVFLLVWSLAALRYERGAERSFDGTLPDTQIEILLDLLKERVDAKAENSERLAQLSLAGLLGFLVPAVRKRLRGILAPLIRSAPWLKQKAVELTFVPALFALEGLALLSPNGDVFTRQVCFGLLWKSSEYETVGPAIEYLRERVKHARKV